MGSHMPLQGPGTFEGLMAEGTVGISSPDIRHLKGTSSLLALAGILTFLLDERSCNSLAAHFRSFLGTLTVSSSSKTEEVGLGAGEGGAGAGDGCAGDDL